MKVSLSQWICFFTLGCCFLFSVIVTSILWSSQKVELAFSRDHYAYEVENQTNILKQQILINNIYDRHYSADNWLIEQDKLINLLQLAPDLTPQQQTIQNSISSQSQSVKRLFSKINENKLINANAAIKSHLKNRLMIQLENIRSDSVQLSTIAKNDIHSVIKRQVLLIISILVISVFILVYGSFRLIKIFKTSLDEVKNAFKKTHSGHYQQIQLSNHSAEFDSIVQAYNLMNYKLSETTFSLGQMKKIVDDRTHDLEQLTKIDPLTKVANRRALFERGALEVSREHRTHSKLTLMLLDCDYFKKVNDQYGHQVGDELLKHVCNICNQEIRDIDVLARYGGEEFVIMLPDCDLNGGVETAKRIQLSLAKHCLIIDKEVINMTLSIGVSTFSEQHTSFEQLISDADKAMYLAKNNGRNRIEVSEQYS